ncbi:LuxR C-terminal-related transcriptional regulator [Nocardioides sp.]|uniref:helix-turn-helix transcriptional regulator n=1 Tax=Nocardioides sp. TaxID=35761 RepID=UPI001A2AA399|nr:LuxR C-terminal-related transcriptional regulator [Nocardioides sp.]MBJ7357902.1 helix-turn-helix transcriptional regulator [Nocardioides sp.]
MLEQTGTLVRAHHERGVPSVSGVPDVALVVVEELDDIATTLRAAGDLVPGARLVVLSALQEPGALVAAVAAGADGWVRPEMSGTALRDAVAGIARGESGFSRADTAVLVTALRRQMQEAVAAGQNRGTLLVPLTPREREISDAVRAGRSTREIARELSLSEVTVRWHAGRAAKKLQEASVDVGSAPPARSVPPSRPAARAAARPALTVTGRGSGKGLGAAELRVALLVAEGLSNKDIAEQLFISRHTVESHLKQTFVKLGVRSRVELTRVILASAAETG